MSLGVKTQSTHICNILLLLLLIVQYLVRQDQNTSYVEKQVGVRASPGFNNVLIQP